MTDEVRPRKAWSELSEDELRDIAWREPPSDPTELAELQAELRRRAAAQRAASTTLARAALQRVVVSDVEMPFWSMVAFMVKWVIASIPAIIILAMIGLVVLFVLAAFASALGLDRLGR